MASTGSRGLGFVCRSCRLQQHTVPILSRCSVSAPKPAFSQPLSRVQRRTITSNKIPSPVADRRPAFRPQPKPPKAESAGPTRPLPSSTPEDEIDADNVRGSLEGIQAQVNTLCDSRQVPEDADVLIILYKAYRCSNLLIYGDVKSLDEIVAAAKDEETLKETSILSDLDEPSAATLQKESTTATSRRTPELPVHYRQRLSLALCESVYNLFKDPKVRITEPMLSMYVRIMCEIGHPEYLPEIFFLYANKPQPLPKSDPSNPVRYRKPSPNSPQNAIPITLSERALDAAIVQGDLDLAVAIIDTTVATPSFRRNKFLKKASLPLTLVASTPVAAYAAADWVANWQNSLDPAMAKTITLMASAAYIGTLTTIGFVALTTWNDHHERVRWSEGTPLRQRWTREEERLYFDRLALAWGFENKSMRGEEMGGLWEALRDECGARGLVLDKSDLLPGMQ